MTEGKGRPSKSWVGVSDFSDWVLWEKHVSICSVLVSFIGFQWHRRCTKETWYKKASIWYLFTICLIFFWYLFIYRHRRSFCFWREGLGGRTYRHHPLGLSFCWRVVSEIRAGDWCGARDGGEYFLGLQKKQKEIKECQYSVNTWSFTHLKTESELSAL